MFHKNVVDRLQQAVMNLVEDSSENSGERSVLVYL